LSSALRGVICQALLPSTKGDSYYLATECLTVNPEVAALIENGDTGAIRPLLDKLNTIPDSGCHTMNDDLFALIKAKKVGMDDARKATTDRMKFIDMFK